MQVFALISFVAMLLHSASAQYNKEASEALRNVFGFSAATQDDIIAFDEFVNDYTKYRGNLGEIPNYYSEFLFMETVKLSAEGDTLGLDLKKSGEITPVGTAVNGQLETLNPVSGFLYNPSKTQYTDAAHMEYVNMITSEFQQSWKDNKSEVKKRVEANPSDHKILVGNKIFAGKYNEDPMGDYVLVPIVILKKTEHS